MLESDGIAAEVGVAVFDHDERGVVLKLAEVETAVEEREEEGRCEVCRHPKRDAIEADLVNGVGYARLEKLYGVAEWTLGRHKRLHLRREVQAASAGGQRTAAPVAGGERGIL